MAEFRIAPDLVAAENDRRAAVHKADYTALAEKLARNGIDIETVTAKVVDFFVAVPSWGVGTGGTRFARFPGQGRSEEHTSELQSLMRISYAVFCLKKKKNK